MGSFYKGNNVKRSGDTMTGNLAVSGVFSTENIAYNSTVINTVTATGDFVTLTVNNSAVAFPIYIY